MFSLIASDWSRVTSLRVIFIGLAFAASVWILDINLADLFFDWAMPLYHFFADGWAIAFGVCLAMFGCYKLFAARS